MGHINISGKTQTVRKIESIPSFKYLEICDTILKFDSCSYALVLVREH